MHQTLSVLRSLGGRAIQVDTILKLEDGKIHEK